MKDYVKPAIEIVELRPEERLACCTGCYKNPSQLANVITWLLLHRRFCKETIVGASTSC